jgi:SHS2 domain-containing protein
MKDAPGFEIIDHPSDVGIGAAGRTAGELFEFAAAGMFSLMTDIESIKPLIIKNVMILKEPGIRIDGLFLIWLEELLYIYEIENMLFSRFSVLGINTVDTYYRRDGIPGGNPDGKDTWLEAKIYGEEIDLERHEILVSIKAPTYHMLEVKEDRGSGLWKGKVIFDV